MINTTRTNELAEDISRTVQIQQSGASRKGCGLVDMADNVGAMDVADTVGAVNAVNSECGGCDGHDRRGGRSGGT